MLAELNIKQQHYFFKKREDNKHTIAKIYGICVLFKLSPGNK